MSKIDILVSGIIIHISREFTGALRSGRRPRDLLHRILEYMAEIRVMIFCLLMYIPGHFWYSQTAKECQDKPSIRQRQ